MNENTHCFFAASNSYDGFVSYFSEIFSPENYEKIYILKGGPGTGKSSFMKAIINAFKEKEVNYEAIYCSSDPKSLDGLILEHSSKKIAIVDGTAPHSTDPTYPGAIEKIVNLGDFWNEKLLQSNNEKIKELSARKKQFYQNAYQYLSVAKSCSDIVFNSIKEATTLKNESISDLFKNSEKDKGIISTKLYSAFCKDGFVDIPLPFTDKTKIIDVVGIYGSEYFFMQNVFNTAKEYGLDLTVSPSPLDRNKYDYIFLKNSDIIFRARNKVSCKNTRVVDTSKFINTKKLENVRNKIETLYKEKEAMLWSATDEFKKAYDTHIELEKIYTAAMNFKKNQKKIEKVCEEINFALSLRETNA